MPANVLRTEKILSFKTRKTTTKMKRFLAKNGNRFKRICVRIGWRSGRDEGIGVGKEMLKYYCECKIRIAEMGKKKSKIANEKIIFETDVSQLLK